MRTMPFDLFKESYESMSRAGRFNQALKVKWRDRHGVHKAVIGAGRDDDVHLFAEGDWLFGGALYCVSINSRFPYVGLQSYSGAEEFDEGIFLQGSEQVEEVLGRNGEDKSPIWIAKVLSQYVE
jgi:hypothetical protein